MEVKYFIKREDLWKGAKFTSRKQITKKGIYISLAFFLLVNIFLFFDEEYPIIFIEIVFLAIYLPYLLYRRMRIKRFIMNNPKENKGILGEHKIQLLEGGFREITEVNDSFHSWKGVSRVDSNDEYILICIDNSLLHIIPKRNFSSLSDAIRFEEKAIELFNNRFIK